MAIDFIGHVFSFILNLIYFLLVSSKIISSKVSYWARNGGGGHLGDTVFATGGHEKFFRKVDSFWRFPPKTINFSKNFFVPQPPPPVANTVTPKCPSPIACPVRHIFGKFLIF